MDERSPIQGIAAIRCELWPECQCDRECDPFAYEPLSGPELWILAGITIAAFVIALGLFAYLAWQALS